MKHIDNQGALPESHAPIEWLGVGTTVADLTNEISGRRDIIAVVGPDAAHGAPACFIPHRSEVELNSATAFGPQVSPESVGDLTNPKLQYDFPRAVGLIAHEAFHARYSRWDKERVVAELNADEVSAFEMLEESRIEYHGLQDSPRYRDFIRSAVVDINLGEELDTDRTEAAFAAFALINARIQAGTLLESEVEDVAKKVNAFLGADMALHLYGIAEKFQQSRSLSEMLEMAKEWSAAKKQTAEEKGEQTGGLDPQELAQALSDALEEIMLKASISLADQEAKETREALAAENNRQAKDRKRNQRDAEQVFGKSSGLGSELTSSYMTERRKPTAVERAAAVIVAKELEKAKYHDRIEIDTDNYLPPGRLRTRTLVQARAAESKGLRLSSTPWRRTKRKHSIDPNLTVGVMVDISGSMNRAMEPMGVTAWVMSEAVRRVQGKVAMTYYGDSVFPGLRPGEHLDQVYIYGAFDGTESFDKAFRSLDGALSLLDGSGARLLVVCSDGHYRADEIERAQYWMTECASAGVAVLWLPYDSGNSLTRITNSIPTHHISVVTATTSPAEVATQIGRAAATALSQAGQ